MNISDENILVLYPGPIQTVSLEKWYLQQDLISRRGPFVYTNYIVSLDGRIALDHPETGKPAVPKSIANDRDWRLFQELAAQADVLIASARYARDLAAGTAQDQIPVSTQAVYADLLEWRVMNGLTEQPAFVIVSASLEIPLEVISANPGRVIYIATGAQSDPDKRRRLEDAGARILIAGEGQRVTGVELVSALSSEGYERMYAVSGPELLDTLLADQVLDRLYLTQMHRLLGGRSFDTLLESHLLHPPVDCRLKALYYDPHGKEDAGQIFAVYDLRD